MNGSDDSKATKFDETYSLMLQGYIDPQEWRTEIAAVNQIYTSAAAAINRWIFVPVICLVVIAVLIIIGLLTSFVLIPIAFALMVFGIMFCVFMLYKVKRAMMEKLHEHIDIQNQRVWLPRGIQWRIRTEVLEEDNNGHQPYGNQAHLGFGNQQHGFGQPQHGRPRKTRTVHWIEIELAPRRQGQVVMPVNLPMSSVPPMSHVPPMPSVQMPSVQMPSVQMPPVQMPSVPMSSMPPMYSPPAAVEERIGLLSNDGFNEVPLNPSTVPLSKFCGKCGTPTVVNESFCRNCGSYCRNPA
jgi:hypothetical protein